MNQAEEIQHRESQQQVEQSYSKEKPRLINRLRKFGRTLEEAEDMLQDLYVEILERLPLVADIQNFPGWIYSLFSRRLIDLWRRDQRRANSGETKVAEEILREISDKSGLNPLDDFVQNELVEALNMAIKILPTEQRHIIEAQVFGGWTFRKISETTGENTDTLKARKRYAVKTLSQALQHWMND